MPRSAGFVYIPRAVPDTNADFYSPGVQILTCQMTRVGASWEGHSFSAPYWRLYWNPDTGASVRYAGEEVAAIAAETRDQVAAGRIDAPPQLLQYVAPHNSL